MRRASALLMALWIIAVLSVMVLSFATEAHLYTGVNVWVRERNRLNRLIEPGRVLAEIVMLGYADAKEPEISNGEPDWTEIFEDEDRWCREKYALKNQTRCTIGPILMDETDVHSGTVTVEIELVNSGESGININMLYNGGDKDYVLRWQQILQNSGVDEELEVEVTEADGRTTKKRNFMNHLLACWNDWRKGSATSSRGPIEDQDPQEEDGAGVGRKGGNGEYYREYYERLGDEARGKEAREQLKTEEYYPKEGEEHEISDIKELEYIRGFRDFPSILTGGYLYDNTPYEKDFEKERGSETNPMLQGIIDLFGISGSSKIVINDKTSIRQLLTIPGIFQVSGGNVDDDAADSRELAQAILDGLRIEPDDADERIAATDASGRRWWPYKDESDLSRRLEDTYSGSVELGNEAAQYIEWNVSETSVFKVRIVGESMGMTREVNAECYVKDKKVRYIKWRED